MSEKTEEFMEAGKEVVPGMKLRCICRGHTGNIRRIAWSPCGRFIASPSQDTTIRIWDASNGESLAVLHTHRDLTLSDLALDMNSVARMARSCCSWMTSRSR